MMNKKLILVASPPACGKTYVSEMIARSVEGMVYLDKDDLSDLIRAAFAVAGKPLDMDGEFYKSNLRGAEYSTILNIAYSTLRFEKFVLLNAPFGKEVRDTDTIKALKKRANDMGAELVLIWISVPTRLCYERIKKRNSDRDTLKLKNWGEYVKNINYTPPYQLEKEGAVDKFFVFDNTDGLSAQASLKDALKIILENNYA